MDERYIMTGGLDGQQHWHGQGAGPGWIPGRTSGMGARGAGCGLGDFGGVVSGEGWGREGMSSSGSEQGREAGE